MVSWQTRTLATMIAGGYMTDEKKGNPALDMAMKLGIDEIDSVQLEDGIAARKDAPVQAKENSYEKVMGAFGGKLTVGK